MDAMTAAIAANVSLAVAPSEIAVRTAEAALNASETEVASVMLVNTSVRATAVSVPVAVSF